MKKKEYFVMGSADFEKWDQLNVISTLKLSGWPTNLVFSQLKDPISLNCYKDIYH